jgi:hypothetical protein
MKAYKGGKTSHKQDEKDPNLLRVIENYEKQGKKLIASESGKKFSEMLLQLITPFHGPVPELDELERLLDIAAVAWNIANMKKLLPPAAKIMTEEARLNFTGDKEAIQILEKLIKAKTKKYPQEELFIKDFTVEPVKDGGYFTVVAIPLQDFLSSGINETDELDEENNFAPGYINRNGFSVAPRQSFYNWLRKIEGNSLFPGDVNESAVYLLEEKGSNEEITEWLITNFDSVFQKELAGRISDEKKWPKNRTYQMFSEWFEVKFHSLVYDFEDYPVDKDME